MEFGGGGQDPKEAGTPRNTGVGTRRRGLSGPCSTRYSNQVCNTPPYPLETTSYRHYPNNAPADRASSLQNPFAMITVEVAIYDLKKIIRYHLVSFYSFRRSELRNFCSSCAVTAWIRCSIASSDNDDDDVAGARLLPLCCSCSSNTGRIKFKV